MKVLCEACGVLAEARLLGRPGGAVVLCSSCGKETPVPSEPKAKEVLALPADEEAAFAKVQERWDDDEAHQAFLSRFRELEGLARAGARYREVLAARPGDGPAARARDEILRRATALGLGELPRTSVRGEAPGAVKWGAVALLLGALLGAAVWVTYTLVSVGATR